MKRLILLALTFVLAVCIPLNAFAEPEVETRDEYEIAPCYLYTSSITTTISIKDKTASCVSKVYGYSTIATRVEITQTLEKKNGSDWDTKATWTGSADNWYCILTNTKGSLTSGTYRVKTVTKVYKGSNSETLTAYSKESVIS